jgi:hypothetical protein
VERPEVRHQSAAALRAFIRVARNICQAAGPAARGPLRLPAHRPRDRAWGRRIGDLRFETDGAWKRTGSTVDLLAKELKLALQYPEGAMV